MTTTAGPGRAPAPPWTRGRVLRWGALGVVVLAVLVVGGVWLARRSAAAVNVSTRSFRIFPTYAQLTFDVSKPASKSVRCDIQAESSDNRLVGHLDGVAVPARSDGRRVTTVRVTVRTSERANVVEVVQCVAGAA